jgi:hypothetical protein
MNPAVKSYLRHVAIALTPLLTVQNSDWRHYLFAVALAILGPFIRAIDPADKEFGVTNDD